MKDLYSKLFFKTQFEIKAAQPKTELLGTVVKHVKNRIVSKYKKKNDDDAILKAKFSEWKALKNGGKIRGTAILLEAEYCYTEDPCPAHNWACRIVEIQSVSGFAPRKWVTDIGFRQKSEDRAEISFVVSYRDRPGFLGECLEDPSPNIPGIILQLWGDNKLICTDGIDTPTFLPKELRAGQWPEFWERIKDEKRNLPYIYISPLNGADEHSVPLIDPKKLALALGGNAIVYYAKDFFVTEEMNFFCKNEYLCYDGALRVYMPALDENDPEDAVRHRYFGRDYMKSIGSERVIAIIRRALAQNENYYDSIFRLENCREIKDELFRKERIETLIREYENELKIEDEKHRENAESIRDAIKKEVAVQKTRADEAEKREKEEKELNDWCMQINATLTDQIKEIKRQNNDYQKQINAMSVKAKECEALREAGKSRLSVKDWPKEADDIVNYFSKTFCDKLIFAESVKRSLKDCEISNSDLWTALYCLAVYMTDLYIKNVPDPYKQFSLSSGLSVARSEGENTRKNKDMMRLRTVIVDGETVNIEPHIKIDYGNKKKAQRIYFGFSKKQRVTVVGWCGEHLPISSDSNHH